MKLLTKELCRKIPPLYTTEDTADPTIVAKFFTPDADWTWYVIEGATRHEGCSGFGCEEGAHDPLTEWREGDDALFFGLVDGLEKELGFFDLATLREIRGGLGLPVERDLHWTPEPLSTFYEVVRVPSLCRCGHPEHLFEDAIPGPNHCPVCECDGWEARHKSDRVDP